MNLAQHFGTYDHSDRNLLILAVILGICLAVYFANKFFK